MSQEYVFLLPIRTGTFTPTHASSLGTRVTWNPKDMYLSHYPFMKSEIGVILSVKTES